MFWNYQKSADQPCFYCGNLSEGYDHIVALGAGGPDESWNLVPACNRCNGRKGVRSVEAFRLYIALKDERWPVVFYGENAAGQPHRDMLFVASKRGRGQLVAHNMALFE